MKPKTAIQKGKDLENYVADQIRLKGIDLKASRSIGSGSGNREKADIDTSMMILGRNVGFECKNYANAKVKDWWTQAEKLETLGREPIVAYKLKNEYYEDTKVIIRLNTFLDLAKRGQEPMMERKDDYEFRNKLALLVRTCNWISNYLKKTQ